MSKYKIIYSLRIHIALQQMGFKCIQEMDNPTNNKYRCWVYEETKELLNAFDQLMVEQGGRKYER